MRGGGGGYRSAHSRSRQRGTPIVFKSVERSISFWRINPNSLAQEIVSATQDKVLTQGHNKDGTLTISVSSSASASSPLQDKILVNTPVEVRVPISYTDNVENIWSILLEHTDVQNQE